MACTIRRGHHVTDLAVGHRGETIDAFLAGSFEHVVVDAGADSTCPLKQLPSA